MLRKQHVVELAKPFSPPSTGNRVTDGLIFYLKSLSKETGFKRRMEGSFQGREFPRVRNRRMGSELNWLVPSADERGIC